MVVYVPNSKPIHLLHHPPLNLYPQVLAAKANEQSAFPEPNLRAT